MINEIITEQWLGNEIMMIRQLLESFMYYLV